NRVLQGARLEQSCFTPDFGDGFRLARVAVEKGGVVDLLGHGCLRSDREAEEIHHPENVAAQGDREGYRKFKRYFSNDHCWRNDHSHMKIIRRAFPSAEDNAGAS